MLCISWHRWNRGPAPSQRFPSEIGPWRPCTRLCACLSIYMHALTCKIEVPSLMGQNDVRRFPPLARTLTLVPWIIISLAKSKFPSFPLILQRSTGSCYFEDSFGIKKLSQFKGLKSPASPFALILSSSPFSYFQWEFSSSWKFSVNIWSLQTCCSISLRPSEI